MLFEQIGIGSEQIFCTSVPGSDVKLDESFRVEIKTQFTKHSPHFIRVQSENSLKSTICQNEVGAAWILGIPFSTILLPGFDRDLLTSITDPSIIAISLDRSHAELRDKLSQLCSTLLSELDIQRPSDDLLNSIIDQFIDEIITVRNDQIRQKHEESVSKATLPKRPSWL